MILGWGDKEITDYWGTVRKNVLKPLYFRLVLIKCFQCLRTDSNKETGNKLAAIMGNTTTAATTR